MRESVIRYSGGGVPITDEELTHNAVSLAANSKSANAFINVEKFSQAIVLIDASENFTVSFNLSNNNVDSYILDSKPTQSAGKHSYIVNIKGAKYLNVTVTNETANVATLTQRIMLATG